MLARDKHSSLLQKFVNYGQIQYYNIGARSQYLFSFSPLQTYLADDTNKFTGSMSEQG